MSLFSVDDNSARVTFPPPAVFVGMLLTGGLLDRLAGVERFWLGWPMISVVAMVLGVPALYLLGNALLAFVRAGVNPEPWKEAKAFVANGPYRFTRNPMYLGMALGCAAVAFGFGSPSALLLLPLTLWLITRFVIAKEEAYLAGKFGQTYLEYRSKVRRWI